MLADVLVRGSLRLVRRYTQRELACYFSEVRQLGRLRSLQFLECQVKRSPVGSRVTELGQVKLDRTVIKDRGGKTLLDVGAGVADFHIAVRLQHVGEYLQVR